MTNHESPNADLLASLDRALAGGGRLIAGIGAHQWSTPTPCTDWNVRAVVDHLVSGNLNFAALVRDEPRPDHGPEQLADDPVAAYRSAAATMHAAFAEPGVLERVYQAPIGSAPGSVLAHLRITELLVHGWDLARATGQPPELPADIAEGELALWRAQFEGGPGAKGLPFAPARPVADEAPAIDRLAAFLGRDPRWAHGDAGALRG